MQINEPKALQAVTDAFHAYERALMSDDIAAMDGLFRAGVETVRYGVGETLYGIEAIREFRKQRGGAPQRELTRVEITTYGDAFATANAEFRNAGADRIGRQSQAWVRFADGWRIVSAHISMQAGG
jgi:hypothetical protein